MAVGVGAGRRVPGCAAGSAIFFIVWYTARNFSWDLRCWEKQCATVFRETSKSVPACSGKHSQISSGSPASCARLDLRSSPNRANELSLLRGN